MTTATALTLRVHGALYLLEIESEEGDLDWLARVILEVTERPRSVSELMHCFGLPRRMLEDVIAQLIEGHLLLLDVSRGEVRTSGLPIVAHGARRSETALVWQDHFSGTILPWSAVRPYSEAKPGSEAGPVEDLVGGPPRRHVLEMSDAELLTHLERFRPGATWSEVITRRERVDRQATMLLKADRDDEGRLTIFDPIPRALIRQWGRRPKSGVRMPAATRVDLPEPWRRIVAEWSTNTSRRIDDLQERKETETTRSAGLFGRLREVIERHSQLELHDNPPRKLRQRVVEGGENGQLHRIVLSTYGTTDAWAAGLDLWRKARAEQKKVLAVGNKQKPKASQAEAVAKAGGEIQMSGRSDVELCLLDDRELWVGGQLNDRPLALCLRSAWPLQPLLAWLPESFSWDAASFPRSQGAEYVRSYVALSKIAALEEGLHEVEAALSATDAPPPSGELIEQLRHDVESIEKELNALDPRHVIAFDHLEVLEILEGRRGARLLVRDLTSPLAAFRADHELIVWSTSKPAPPNRWLNEPGACEIAVVDDVVIFGWWQYPGDDDSAPPPFIAVHAPEVAAALRARSDNALLIQS